MEKLNDADKAAATREYHQERDDELALIDAERAGRAGMPLDTTALPSVPPGWTIDLCQGGIPRISSPIFDLPSQLAVNSAGLQMQQPPQNTFGSVGTEFPRITGNGVPLGARSPAAMGKLVVGTEGGARPAFRPDVEGFAEAFRVGAAGAVETVRAIGGVAVGGVAGAMSGIVGAFARGPNAGAEGNNHGDVYNGGRSDDGFAVGYSVGAGPGPGQYSGRPGEQLRWKENARVDRAIDVVGLGGRASSKRQTQNGEDTEDE